MLTLSVGDCAVTGDVLEMLYMPAYVEGDEIRLTSDSYPVPIFASLCDTMPFVPLYLTGPFAFPVPFGKTRDGFSPRAFTGEKHLIRAEIKAHPVYGNRALNPYDHHGNSTLYPHATANVETRGEAQFFARNAIDGVTASQAHGPWPYDSWGINRDPDAALTVDFGRPVTVRRAEVTLRADFPHDAWWTQGTLTFDDGTAQTLHFKKTGLPQGTDFAPVTTQKVVLEKLIKADDPSPFPALIQLELWG